VFALSGTHRAGAGIPTLGCIPSPELEKFTVLEVHRKTVPWHQKGLHKEESLGTAALKSFT